MSDMEVVEKIYSESVEKVASELGEAAAEFSRDTSRQNFFRVKLTLERIERDISVRDALRRQIGVLS